MGPFPLQGEAGERGSRRAKFTRYVFIGMVVLGGASWSVVSFSRPPRVEHPAARVLKPTRENLTAAVPFLPLGELNRSLRPFWPAR